jgi:hypothetical protein
VTATFIYLMIALKIPIAALLYLVWWAIKQTPEGAEDGEGGGGSRRPPPRHPRRPFPRIPRRGPHGAPEPPAPARVRSVTARGRRLDRHAG